MVNTRDILNSEGDPNNSSGSWLDGILGALGNFAKSDGGKQFLSGLAAQALSTQSYGGQTFFSGVQGAKNEQKEEDAKEQLAFLNNIKSTNAKSSLLNSLANKQKANTDEKFAGYNAETKRQSANASTKKAETDYNKYVLKATEYIREKVVGKKSFDSMNPNEQRQYVHDWISRHPVGSLEDTWWDWKPTRYKRR